MKKVVFLLAIVLILAGCGIDIDSLINSPPDITTVNTGRLTITGLAEYNGKYIVIGDGGLIFDVNMELLPYDDWIGLLAAAAYDLDALTLTGIRVNNGRVTLNVWQANYDEKNDDFTLTRFTGNGFAALALYVSDSPVFSDDNFEYDYMVGFVFPKFNNGVGSGGFTTDIPPEWEDIFGEDGDSVSVGPEVGPPGFGPVGPPEIGIAGMWAMDLSREEVFGRLEIKSYGLRLFPHGHFDLVLFEDIFDLYTGDQINYRIHWLLHGSYTVSANTITLYEGGHSHHGTINGEQITIPGFLKYADDSPKTAVFRFDGRWGI